MCLSSNKYLNYLFTLQYLYLKTVVNSSVPVCREDFFVEIHFLRIFYAKKEWIEANHSDLLKSTYAEASTF